MLESTDSTVERPTREVNITMNGGNHGNTESNTTPLRDYSTSVSTPAYGFNQPINPRRLTSTGGVGDSLHSTLAVNTPAVPTINVNNNNDGARSLPVPPVPPLPVPPLQLASSHLSAGAGNITSIENLIRRYGKDLISNINVLWYYSNMQNDPNRTTTLTVTPTESLITTW